MMKKLMILLALLLATQTIWAQKSRTISLMIVNTQPAQPFSKGVGLVTDAFHPGIEVGRTVYFKQGKRHSYSWDVRAGYFYHRFVQHGIPLYLNVGYDYMVTKNFRVYTKLGGGYLHSIPATAKLRANENGVYKNDKGIGRSQVMAAFELGLSQTLHSRKRPLTLFLGVQQRFQMRFIRSYVPVLPYNNIMLGVQRPLFNHH